MVLSLSCVLETPPPSPFPLLPLPPLLLCLFQTLIINEAKQDAFPLLHFFNYVPVINVNQVVTLLALLFCKLTHNDVQYRENCYRTNWWRLTQSAEQFSVECQKWPVTVFPSSVIFLAILSDDTFAIWYWASEIQSHKSLEWSICNHYNHFGCRCSRCRCYYYCLSYFFSSLVHWP